MAGNKRYAPSTAVVAPSDKEGTVGRVYERIGDFDGRWLEDLYLVRCPDGFQLFWGDEIVPVRKETRRWVELIRSIITCGGRAR